MRSYRTTSAPMLAVFCSFTRGALLGIESRESVPCTAELERSRVLQRFELQQYPPARELVERCPGQQGRTSRMTGDAFRGGPHVVEIRDFSHCVSADRIWSAAVRREPLP